MEYYTYGVRIAESNVTEADKRPHYLDFEEARQLLAEMNIHLTPRQMKRSSDKDAQGKRKLPWVITHRHFRRADRDEAPDFRAPLPGSPISESMCAWIALICSA
jgi:hypothetical protein